MQYIKNNIMFHNNLQYLIDFNKKNDFIILYLGPQKYVFSVNLITVLNFTFNCEWSHGVCSALKARLKPGTSQDVRSQGEVRSAEAVMEKRSRVIQR